MITTTETITSSVVPQPRDTPTVEFVIPVYNEEVDLAPSVQTLDDALASWFPYPYRITIADNASTDRTWAIADGLAHTMSRVRAVHLDQKGRGRALSQVWTASDAEVVAYMDVDLSTDLRAILPLVAPLISGHSDVAIGTRLAGASRVVRGPKREIISRCYNALLHLLLRVRFSDAQCGFKAMRADAARQLLPLVRDTNWFFDTELLVLAQRAGLRIHEVPVDWTDDPGTTVNIVATASEDLRGIWRVARSLAAGEIPLAEVRAALHPDWPQHGRGPRSIFGQLVRFGAIGVASTVAYFLLYLALRTRTDPQVANLLALFTTAIANTAANRRFTFGLRGRENVVRHHAGGLGAFALALGLTSGSLAAVQTWWPNAAASVEVVVLTLANAAATLLRFLALRLLMHDAQPGRDAPPPVDASASRAAAG